MRREKPLDKKTWRIRKASGIILIGILKKNFVHSKDLPPSLQRKDENVAAVYKSDYGLLTEDYNSLEN